MNTQNNTENTSMLRKGIVLRNIYRIDRYLASGGFSNTYVAYNTEFGEQVAIKEFFLRGVAAREEDQTSVSISNVDSLDVFNEQKEKFKKEARRLRQFKNPHIVGVHDLFEENGTAYYVMDYIDGENLRERMKRTGNPLSEKEVRLILPQVLDALRTVHEAGLWHLDLKPGNIMVDKSGNVKLIDFGASKQIDKQRGGATAHTTISFTPGYAPREQMEQNYAKFGPWTDIYALGATLYALLTNSRPPTPSDIDDDDSEDKHEALPMPPEVSDEMRDLIIRMMNTNRRHRPQSVDEILPQENTQDHSGVNDSGSFDDDQSEHTEYVSQTGAEETQYTSQATSSGIGAEETQFSNVYDSHEQTDVAESDTDDCSDAEDNEKSHGWNIPLIILGVLEVFVILCFIIPHGCNRGSGDNSYASDTVDTMAIDTFAVDTVAADSISMGRTYVNNLSVTIKGMGKCKYTGQYDEYGEYPDGEGEARFSDGRYYKGSFVAGEMHGKAYFLYPNGDKFEGEFKDNKFHYGTYTVKEDGSYYKGYFSNGKPSSGTWYDKQGNVLEQVK